MVQPRDFVGVHDIVTLDDGTVYDIQCSVPNDEKTPDTDGHTRGTLTAAGWRIRVNGDGLDLSYIIKGTHLFVRTTIRILILLFFLQSSPERKPSNRHLQF